MDPAPLLVAERLRSKHIRTLQLTQRLLEENRLLKGVGGVMAGASDDDVAGSGARDASVQTEAVEDPRLRELMLKVQWRWQAAATAPCVCASCVVCRVSCESVRVCVTCVVA
jgi:hypothetical protein